MNSVHSFVTSTKNAKESFEKLMVTPDSAYSFASFVNNVRIISKALCSVHSRIMEEDAEMRKTYIKKVADEKLFENEKTYAAQVKSHKERLQKNLADIVTAKKSVLQDFMMIVPPDAPMKLLDNYQNRILAGEEISDTEWNTLVSRISDTGNYQAIARLNALAKKLNRDFKMPFVADESIEDIDNIEKMLSNLIDGIDTPEEKWGYWQTALLSGNDNAITETIKKLDSMLGASVPEKQATIIERLKEAAQCALHNEADSLFREIHKFIAANSDKLQTAEEAEREISEQAEELISKGLATGEK